MDLPKFLRADDADNDCSDLFIIHTRRPRFIARVTYHGTGPDAEQVLDLNWIDAPGDLNAEPLRQLMHEASAYLRRAQDE